MMDDGPEECVEIVRKEFNGKEDRWKADVEGRSSDVNIKGENSEEES